MVTVGTVDHRSLVEPTRFIARHKSRTVKVIEAECTQVDHENKVITIQGNINILKKKKLTAYHCFNPIR
jgi:NADH:ubiquinone reductase (non-electrogenic)